MGTTCGFFLTCFRIGGQIQLPSLTSDPEKCAEEPTFIFYSEYFGELNGKIGLKMAKLVKLTSNIDLDLPASKSDLRSWKMCRGTYIYFLFWAFWCIKRWNRLKNGQVSEIDLQYWPRPPSFQVWPPIPKNVKGNLLLVLILSILVY